MGGMGRWRRRHPLGIDDRRWTQAVMRRGDIHSVDLDPARGSEANKRRPAVILSNDAANATAARLGRGVITVVPVTADTPHIYPFPGLLPASDTGLHRRSKAHAQPDQSLPAQPVADRP